MSAHTSFSMASLQTTCLQVCSVGAPHSSSRDWIVCSHCSSWDKQLAGAMRYLLTDLGMLLTSCNPCYATASMRVLSYWLS